MEYVGIVHFDGRKEAPMKFAGLNRKPLYPAVHVRRGNRRYSKRLSMKVGHEMEAAGVPVHWIMPAVAGGAR